MKSRVERIKVLQRLEEKRRRLPKLLLDLSRILNKHIDESQIVSLDEIERHRVSLNSTDFDFNSLKLSFPKEKVQQLSDKLKSLSKFNDQSFVGLRSGVDITVISLPLADVIDHFAELLQLAGDAISLYDENYKFGFTIDLYQEYWFYEEKLQFLWIYEFNVFGADWIKTIINSN